MFGGKLVLYGCGDCINDYEGITGHERYRGDLRLLYFASLHPGTGTLAALRMAPLQARNLRLHRARQADARWLGTAVAAGQPPFRLPGRPPARRSAGAAARAVMSRAASPPDLAAAARAAGIGDERVLAAIRATPRAGFIPADYVTAAYRDEPIAIGHRQVTTQPSLSARMIEGLHLAGATCSRSAPAWASRPLCWPAWPPA